VAQVPIAVEADLMAQLGRRLNETWMGPDARSVDEERGRQLAELLENTSRPDWVRAVVKGERYGTRLGSRTGLLFGHRRCPGRCCLAGWRHIHSFLRPVGPLPVPDREIA
jgi:hypothetical protein